MHIIIPVAGEGTRLRPHTHTSPKSLIHVAGKPILGHILDNFTDMRIDSFVIVHGAKGEAIIKYCKHRKENYRFVFQKKRLGLGHAIYTGTRGIKGPTLVILGDTIIEYDYKKLMHAKTNVLAVKAVDEPQRFGIVEVKGTTVVNLEEKPDKPKSNLAITGLYLFKDIQKVYNAISYIIRMGIKTKGEYQITDALKIMLQKGEPFKIAKISRWFDCGTTAALLETNRHLLLKTHYHARRKGVVIKPPVFIPDSAMITNAIIGPNVSIGEKVVLQNVIINDAIINRRAKVKNALLTESIVGEETEVSGGYKKLSVSNHSMIDIP